VLVGVVDGEFRLGQDNLDGDTRSTADLDQELASPWWRRLLFCDDVPAGGR
jgi:hypothetical protein